MTTIEHAGMGAAYLRSHPDTPIAHEAGEPCATCDTAHGARRYNHAHVTCGWCEWEADQSEASPEAIASQYGATPECGPICRTTGHHHDLETCDGCRRLADMIAAAGVQDGIAVAAQRLSAAGMHDGACPEPEGPCTCGIAEAIATPAASRPTHLRGEPPPIDLDGIEMRWASQWNESDDGEVRAWRNDVAALIDEVRRLRVVSNRYFEEMVRLGESAPAAPQALDVEPSRKDENRWRRALETAIPWLEAANAETFHSSELAAMALGFRRALGPIASSIPWDGGAPSDDWPPAHPEDGPAYPPPTRLREALESAQVAMGMDPESRWVTDPDGHSEVFVPMHVAIRETNKARAALASPSAPTAPPSSGGAAPQALDVERLLDAAEEYVEAVDDFLDPENQFTGSRRHHMDDMRALLGEAIMPFRVAALALPVAAPEDPSTEEAEG